MLKTTLAIALSVALATPIAGLAQPREGSIIESAGRAAAGMALQSDASGRRRSRGRTWAGFIMIAAGGVLATAKTRTTTCSGDPWICTTGEWKWYKPLAYPGIGIAVSGVLLATVWSDVPASAHVDLAVTPDRVQVGKTFEF